MPKARVRENKDSTLSIEELRKQQREKYIKEQQVLEDIEQQLQNIG
jgi:hypothetical protein